MKASKDLLTFIKAESIMYRNYYECCMKEYEEATKAKCPKDAINDHFKEAMLNEKIASNLESLYDMLLDSGRYDEEKQLLKGAGIWERVPGKGEKMISYWKMAQEAIERG